MDFLVCGYRNKLENRLDFGDLDPICKVIGAFSNVYQEPVAGI